MTWDVAKDIAGIAGTVIALGALLNGVIEYGAQGAQKRAEQFFVIRKRLFENPTFTRVCTLLRKEAEEQATPAELQDLETCPFEDKFEFLALFEEVALMMNSGLIREPVAHNMFGFYAILCWQSGRFWTDLTKDSKYWKVFENFAAAMERRDAVFQYDPRQLRF